MHHNLSPGTLEHALDQIARDNALTSVTVGRMPVGDRLVHTCTVHWDGFARGVACASGHSKTSIREAVEAALKAAAEERVPFPADVPEIPTLEAAAA